MSVYKSILFNAFSDRIEERLKDKKISESIFKYIANYIDKNNEVLYHNTPTYRLYFSDDPDRKFIYDALDIDPTEITNAIKKISNIDSSWKLLNEPFNILMVLLIRYYTINKNKQGVEISIMFLILSLYSSLHYKFYPYPPNDNIMQYTINRISNKYFFKQYGNVSKALYAVAEGSHEKYKSFLTTDNDKTFTQYFVNLRSRLNNQMKVFSSEYYKDQKEGNYLNISDSENDFDDDNTNNISGLIESITNKTSLNFFSSNINENISERSANLSKINRVVLKNALIDIKNNESDKVTDVIRCIIQTYLMDENNPINSIGSQKFVIYCINIYSKSNTKNEEVLSIKENLDYFLNKYCDKYSTTEREMTRSNYRKAVFVYFVLLITSVVTGNSFRKMKIK